MFKVICIDRTSEFYNKVFEVYDVVPIDYTHNPYFLIYQREWCFKNAKYFKPYKEPVGKVASTVIDQDEQMTDQELTKASKKYYPITGNDNNSAIYKMNDNLPTLEVYRASHVNTFNVSTESGPLFKCPKCGAGMYKDLTKVLASYPPKYEYSCKNCNHIEYLEF